MKLVESVGTKAKDRRKARALLDRVMDNPFWKELTMFVLDPTSNFNCDL
jgi:hypothetical protein